MCVCGFGCVYRVMMGSMEVTVYVCVDSMCMYIYILSFFSRFTLSTTSSQTFHLACFTASLPFSISPATEKEQNKNSLYRREKLDVNKFLYNRAALSP